MKNKRKKIIIIILVILILIPIVPYQFGLVFKDGGSRVFKSLTYEICRYHRMEPVWLDGSGGGWFVGWRIKILGKTIRDDYKDYLAANPEPDMSQLALELAEQQQIAASIEAPDGFYSSETGEYAAEFTEVDHILETGRITLYHNGEVCASGTFYERQEIFGMHECYYLWMKVENVDLMSDDIHIMTYYPDDDSLVQLEYISVADGSISVAAPGGDFDFGTILSKQNGAE